MITFNLTTVAFIGIAFCCGRIYELAKQAGIADKKKKEAENAGAPTTTGSN